MASDINRVILIGRLVRNPELKSTNGGSYLCRFTLASNHSTYNRETKESKDKVGFFPCTVWGKQAETVNKYVTKGQRICVEGHLQFSLVVCMLVRSSSPFIFMSCGALPKRRSLYSRIAGILPAAARMLFE